MLCPHCHKAEQIPQTRTTHKRVGAHLFSLPVSVLACLVSNPAAATTELFYRELVAWLLAEGIRTPAAARELRVQLKVQRGELGASRDDLRAWEEGRVPVPARV